MFDSALILIAHGSKDPRWRLPFEKLDQSLRSDLGEGHIFLCYMEFAKPTLMQAVEKAVNAGIRQIKILPLFMAGGAHLDKDIPPMVDEVKKAFPDLKILMFSPIGEHPKFAQLIYELAVESA